MIATLTIIRYPKHFIPFALLAMAVHHLPLQINKRICFYKLLGCGRNGGFAKQPDWQQWGILTVTKNNIDFNIENGGLQHLYGSFIARWMRLFNCETCHFFLEPLEGHGRWDGRQPFDEMTTKLKCTGPVAVLTRATIRFSKLGRFWRQVDAVAEKMRAAKGFIYSAGVGEMPFFKQATFSIWQDKESMKDFAYRMKEHSDVILKTRKENWYSEELFFRFKLLKVTGTIKTVNPLQGML